MEKNFKIEMIETKPVMVSSDSKRWLYAGKEYDVTRDVAKSLEYAGWARITVAPKEKALPKADPISLDKPIFRAVDTHGNDVTEQLAKKAPTKGKRRGRPPGSKNRGRPAKSNTTDAAPAESTAGTVEGFKV